MNADQLNQKFREDGVRFVNLEGGLVKALIKTKECTGEIFLQGAHVTRFQPAGHDPVLWMSKESCFEAGKAIRGGVPICFPWFGPLANDPTAPSHGMARIIPWDVASVSAEKDKLIFVLTTLIDAFALSYQVSFGSALTMSLSVTLSDESSQSASFEAALHTYLTVGDVKSISIEGLEDVCYIDKVDEAKTKPATGEVIRFDGECDRVYCETTATCRLVDSVKRRVIEIAKTNSHNTVVWNPWIDKSRRMADFGDDEWTQMACIETANVGERKITLAPGQTHVMNAIIACSNVGV